MVFLPAVATLHCRGTDRPERFRCGSAVLGGSGLQAQHRKRDTAPACSKHCRAPLQAAVQRGEEEGEQGRLFPFTAQPPTGLPSLPPPLPGEKQFSLLLWQIQILPSHCLVFSSGSAEQQRSAGRHSFSSPPPPGLM